MWVRETRRQLYLGGFESEEWAAEAFDIVAVKHKGVTYDGLNYDSSRYSLLLPVIRGLSPEKVVECVRARRLSTFTGYVSSPGDMDAATAAAAVDAIDVNNGDVAAAALPEGRGVAAEGKADEKK